MAAQGGRKAGGGFFLLSPKPAVIFLQAGLKVPRYQRLWITRLVGADVLVHRLLLCDSEFGGNAPF